MEGSPRLFAHTRWVVNLPLAVALLLLATASCGEPPEQEATVQWYRGNLHTHTLWSDGDDFPDMVVDWYVEAGYDFLVLSDHNVVADTERWVDVNERLRPAFERYTSRFGGSEIDTVNLGDTTRVRLKTVDELQTAFQKPGRFILIRGEEITERVDSLPVHLNATHIVDYIEPQGGATVAEVLQRNIDAVLAQRERTNQPMIPHINHPNFGWGITMEDILAVEGEQFFEIYNGHPLVHNEGDADHPSVEAMWDMILVARIEAGRPALFGLAVDDAHHYHDMDWTLANPGRGWIMVAADTLSPAAIVAAMEQGRFYASTGVRLESIEYSPDRVALRIQSENGVRYTTQFIGSRVDRDADDPRIGEILQVAQGSTPSYRLKGDELYVRARVISSKSKVNPNRADETERAWTQPFLPGRLVN